MVPTNFNESLVVYLLKQSEFLRLVNADCRSSSTATLLA